MSTPSGKPPSPVDLRTYVSHRAREITERHPSESDNHSPRLPYAPKGADERAGVERHPVANDPDPYRSPYAPKRARSPFSGEPDFAARFEAEPPRPSRAPDEEREYLATERHSVDLDGPDLCPDDAPDGAPALERPPFGERDDRDHSLSTAREATGEYPVDPETAAPLQPAPDAHRGKPAAPRRDEIMTDQDLERLEASLRWLQRQEAATRLARAPQLPPVRRPAPVDAEDRPAGGERYAERVRSPLSLEPERMMPPPSNPRRDLRAPLGILVLGILAASIVYYLTIGSWTPEATPTPGPRLASVASKGVAPPSTSAGREEARPAIARDDEPATSPQGEQSPPRTATALPARSSEGEIVAMLQPGQTAVSAPPPAGGQPPPPSQAIRVLDPTEIKLLMQQGEQFIAAGDLVTARIVFQRAAEAGDATAALALAATYDPGVLAKLGVVGMGGADVEKARLWYQRAESFGSTEAARRLRILAR